MTDDVLAFLGACRQETVAGRPGPERGRPGGASHRPARAGVDQSAAGRGRRPVRVPGDARSGDPVADPQGADLVVVRPGERTGLLAHTKRRPAPRSRLRLRTPRRLPRALSGAEVTALLGSCTAPGSGDGRADAVLRAALVRGAGPAGHRRRHRRPVAAASHGKGGKERRVPLDADLAAVIVSYLLAERPETTATALFVVAKGPTRGPAADPGGAAHDLPLPPADLRGRGRRTARAAAHLRDRAGRGRGGPGGDAGPARATPTSTPPPATSISPRPT